MAFVAEDGTGLELANSMCTVEFANEYFSERGISTWTGTDIQKQAALIRATDYLEKRFSHLFIGDKLSPVQGLSFPRNIAGAAILPVGVKRATCEYAVRTIGTAGIALLPDPQIHASGLGYERLREKAGPIEEEVRFQYQGPGSVRILIRPYPSADMLLKDYLNYSGGRVIRG